MTAESVEEFRGRARAWLAANMPPLDPEKAARLERDSEASWHRARELQVPERALPDLRRRRHARDDVADGDEGAVGRAGDPDAGRLRPIQDQGS